MKALTIAVTAVGAMAIIAGFGLLLAFPLKWTWNYAITYVFGLPLIGWGHAWCLIFVSGMLIKRSASSSSKD